MSEGEEPVYCDVIVIRTVADGLGDLVGWHPWHVIHNAVSGHILVTDWGGNGIRVFSDNPPYTYITKYGQDGEGEVNAPRGITCDSEGRVIVADHGNHRLQVLSSTGQYLGQVTGIRFPWWVCVDGEDNMYVTCDDIRVYNPQGEPIRTIWSRGVDLFTISGEHLYQVYTSNNHLHLRIYSLTDRSDVHTVPLPENIPDTHPDIIACADDRLLLTVWDTREAESYSYIYVLDSAGHLTPRPYRYEGRVQAMTLLYDNTLVVVDRDTTRLTLVALPGLNPPMQPIRPMRVARLQNLCIYTIRSIITTAVDIESLPDLVAPAIKAELSQLY